MDSMLCRFPLHCPHPQPQLHHPIPVIDILGLPSEPFDAFYQEKTRGRELVGVSDYALGKVGSTSVSSPPRIRKPAKELDMVNLGSVIVELIAMYSFSSSPSHKLRFLCHHTPEFNVGFLPSLVSVLFTRPHSIHPTAPL